MSLLNKQCVPCEGNQDPLTDVELRNYMPDVPGWELVEDKHIQRNFEFPDFVKAMAFVDHIADIAESEGHHPDIYISYNKVEIKLWTHATNGLSKNDFIVAAKINALENLKF